jgi:shikimate dehydrogenase
MAWSAEDRRRYAPAIQEMVRQSMMARLARTIDMCLEIDLDRLGLGAQALPELLIAAERMGLNGLYVTHSCKETVIALPHELSDDARALGAVNTVVLKDGRQIGHNTDWWGFAENFRRGLPGAKPDRVVQLGAGGAGSAVAHAALTLV